MRGSFDSCANCLIQLADLLADSIFRHVEYGDSKFCDVIKDRLDEQGGGGQLKLEAAALGNMLTAIVRFLL